MSECFIAKDSNNEYKKIKEDTVHSDLGSDTAFFP